MKYHSRFAQSGDERFVFWMGRHRGGRGFKGFRAGWSGTGGLGHGHFRTGRKLGSDDLQLVILALLADKPSHGYELIKMLEERSSGFYAPSPGMVYPALTYLEEIGYATVAAEGVKKLMTKLSQQFPQVVLTSRKTARRSTPSWPSSSASDRR